MAQQRKLPTAKRLIELAEKHSNQEIADQYGVSAEAVRQALAREGFRREPTRPRHAHYIPWRVRGDHVGDVLAKRLRAYSRREQGFPISESDERLLNEWIDFMEGNNSYGVPLSVHYDRTDREGFWLEPRQAGDRNFISPPAA